MICRNYYIILSNKSALYVILDNEILMSMKVIFSNYYTVLGNNLT
jgi:hypothetical protein